MAKMITLITMITLFSCTNIKEKNEQLFPKASQRPSDLINSSADFTLNSRQDIIDFLDEHLERISQQNLTHLKSKEQYIQEIPDGPKELERHARHRANIAKKFDRNFPKVYQGELFNFYYKDNDRKKTFFYIQEPLTFFSNYFELYLKSQERLKGHNFVVIDTMRVTYRKNQLSAKEINETLISDLEGFYRSAGLKKTKKIFHPICFAYTLSYKLFEERHDLYDQVIYYTPYPRIGKNAQLIRLDEMYEGKEKPKFIDYADVVYLYYIGRGKSLRSWFIPKVWSTVNFETFYNLHMIPVRGRTLEKVKNKSLIHAEFETVLSESSFEKESFLENKIRVLSNRYHNDFLWTGKEDYLQALESLLK